MDFEEKNENMIEVIKKRGDLTEKRLEEAIRNTPRHLFLPKMYRDHAYMNAPLSIGQGQTISQPSVVAKMTQWLQPEEKDKILKIGTGSGWQAAILARLVRKVYTTEIMESLARRARKSLEELGIENVEIIVGDGSAGLEEYAPYDGIVCTAACPEIPEEWREQLKEGGRIVAPVGGEYGQAMTVEEKRNGKMEKVKEEKGYRFVPLKGEKGF